LPTAQSVALRGVLDHVTVRDAERLSPYDAV
jgi:hypothetical protein